MSSGKVFFFLGVDKSQMLNLPLFPAVHLSHTAMYCFSLDIETWVIASVSSEPVEKQIEVDYLDVQC